MKRMQNETRSNIMKHVRNHHWRAQTDRKIIQGSDVPVMIA